MCCSEASGEPAIVLVAIMNNDHRCKGCTIHIQTKIMHVNEIAVFVRSAKATSGSWGLKRNNKQTIKQNKYDCLIC